MKAPSFGSIRTLFSAAVCGFMAVGQDAQAAQPQSESFETESLIEAFSAEGAVMFEVDHDGMDADWAEMIALNTEDFDQSSFEEDDGGGGGKKFKMKKAKSSKVRGSKCYKPKKRQNAAVRHMRKYK